MTGKVIHLDSRRKPPDTCCPRHELDALANRIRERLATNGEALLIPADDLAAALADLESTVDRLLPRGRTEHTR